jgi:SAM-dependent methyltransferase
MHGPMHGLEPASSWVTRFAHLVAPGASVLDVACGGGRHARYFARRGATVDAVDRDASLVDVFRGETAVRFLAADIEGGPWPYDGRRFDAVIVTHYLHRPLFPVLRNSVADGGVLIYETFAHGNGVFGKPSNPAFLLRPGELLETFGDGFFVVAFEDGLLEAPRPARIQRLCALRGGARAVALASDVSDRMHR